MPIISEIWNSSFATKWGRLIANTPETSVFNTPEWINILQHTYNLKPIAFFREELGEITAGIILAETRTPFLGVRLMSLPYTDFCNPVVQKADDTTSLLRYISREHRNVLIRAWGLPEESFKRMPIGYVHVTPLNKDPALLYCKLGRKQVQARIEKAQKAGDLTVSIGTSLQSVEQFHALLRQTRIRLATLMPSRHYFRELHTHLISRGMGRVALVYHKDILVSGGIFLLHKNTMFFKHGASDQRFWGHHPNHILLWHMLRLACSDGLSFFNWGRSGLLNSGLREFKQRWNTVEYRLEAYSNRRLSIRRQHLALRSRRLLGQISGCIPGTIGDAIRTHGYSLFP